MKSGRRGQIHDARGKKEMTMLVVIESPFLVLLRLFPGHTRAKIELGELVSPHKGGWGDWWHPWEEKKEWKKSFTTFGHSHQRSWAGVKIEVSWNLESMLGQFFLKQHEKKKKACQLSISSQSTVRWLKVFVSLFIFEYLKGIQNRACHFQIEFWSFSALLGISTWKNVLTVTRSDVAENSFVWAL